MKCRELYETVESGLKDTLIDLVDAFYRETRLIDVDTFVRELRVDLPGLLEVVNNGDAISFFFGCDDGVLNVNVVDTPFGYSFTYNAQVGGRTVSLEKDRNVYTAINWKIDRNFHAMPGQEIEDLIYDYMMNVLPPKTADPDFLAKNGMAWGFCEGEEYCDGLYQTFGKRQDGRCFYLGLSRPVRYNRSVVRF